MFDESFELAARLFRRLGILGKRILIVLSLAILLVASTIPATDELASIRRYTRQVEFDSLDWTIDAALLKIGQISLNTVNTIPLEQRPEIVLEYFDLVHQVRQKESEIDTLFADPNTSDPEAASVGLRQELARLVEQRDALRPLAEAVLEAQVSRVASTIGLTLGGQPVPPVLYHTTDPPNALIISPRDVIRQDYNIMIVPEMTIEEVITLEDSVAKDQDVSTLVVGIGGIGMYPTMVMETTDINWLAEVVAHEWIHNFLMLRPLGLLYDITPDNRIINETTASIAGKEMAYDVVARYYPEFLPELPAEPALTEPNTPTPEPAGPPPFDFRFEMHTTRQTVDSLLEAGKVAEAEAYMEARRRVFWDNGYRIRKLNQAYFAFYGAYADQPGGAAGEDPVSAAVRRLRADSSTLAEFINRISWIVTYKQLNQITPAR